MRLGIALLAAMAALPAVSQAQASPAAAAPHGLGAHLAELLFPKAQLQEGIRTAWQAQLADRPELREIGAKDPGFVAAIWGAIGPELRALLVRELPGLRQEVGALFEKRLSPIDLRMITAIYESQTGQRILALNFETLGYPATERDSHYAAGMNRIFASMSAADKALMTRAGPSAAKLDPLSPEMNAAISARMTRILAEAEPHLREVADRAGRAYMASKEPKQ